MGAAWRWDDGVVSFTPPTGDRLAIFARYERDGAAVEEPIVAWIGDAVGEARFPDEPWVFGGSTFTDNPSWMEPGRHYAADQSGSIIGLVTFGDEVIGYQQVIADEESVQTPQWQVATDHVPPVGTRVTLIIRPAS